MYFCLFFNLIYYYFVKSFTLDKELHVEYQYFVLLFFDVVYKFKIVCVRINVYIQISLIVE